MTRGVLYIVDTDTVIARFRQNPDAIQAFSRLRVDQVGFSAVTLYEVGKGEYFKGAKRVREFRSFFEHFQLFPLNSTIAEVAAREAARLTQQGLKMSDHDLFIAATAYYLGRTVMTRNVGHFQLYKGLKVEAW